MPYDGGKRLEIYGLVEGLGDAVDTNDPASAERYRERLSLAMEYAGADDPAKSLDKALEELFRISGQWVRGAVVRRDDPQSKKQIQEAVEHAIRLLNIPQRTS
jgi:hypothetical protein